MYVTTIEPFTSTAYNSLVSLFKQRITVERLGFALVGLLFDTAKSPATEKALLDFAQNCDINQERLFREVMYLRAFAVDHAIKVALGTSRMCELVVGSFYGWLQQAARDMTAQGIDNGRVFVQGVSNRVPGYAEAVRHLAFEDTKGLKLGEKFATFCGARPDPLLMLFAWRDFGLMVKLVHEFVVSVKITER
jgi:hypothetical protein